MNTSTNNPPSNLHKRYTFLIQHQSLSLHYLTKRAPKYLYCNFIHFRPPNTTNGHSQAQTTLKRAKHIQRIENLQPIVPQKQFIQLMKHHTRPIITSQPLQTIQTKSVIKVKYIVKKLKYITKYDLKFGMLSSPYLNYLNRISSISIFLQTIPGPLYQNHMIENLAKSCKRLRGLKKISISSGEDPPSQARIIKLFEIANLLTPLKEIQIKFQSSTLSCSLFSLPLDFKEINPSLLSSLQWTRNPSTLFNVFIRPQDFSNLKDLAFKMAFEGDYRFEKFDFRILASIQRLKSLQSLSIIFELCPEYHDFFIEHLRFPSLLKKLCLGLERLNYRRVFEEKNESLQAFCRNFETLELEELNFSVSVDQGYSMTYCDFFRPLMRSQRKLRALSFKYTFKNVMQKLQERKYLHVSEIFSDIEYLESLNTFETYFEILDLTQKETVQPILQENLQKISINMYEARWQEMPTRGFSEDMLSYLVNCTNLKTILMQSRCNKELEDIRRGLYTLRKINKLEKVQISWNVDSLEIEDVCGFLEGVNRPMDVVFGLKQVLMTKNEIDAVIKSMRKNKFLMEVKVSSMLCDVMKHGVDGAPYVYG